MQSHDPGDPIEVIVPGIQPENALRVIAPPPELPIYLVQVPERLICRFCHEQALDEDPLFAPCNCRGTMEFVHVSCLESWIQVRYRLSHRTPLRCEVCNLDYDIETDVRNQIDWTRCCSLQTLLLAFVTIVTLAAVGAAIFLFATPVFLAVLIGVLVFFAAGSCKLWCCVPVVQVRPRPHVQLIRPGMLENVPVANQLQIEEA